MPSLMLSVILFLVALFVSTIIIHLITTLFEEKEGVGTALLAALVGSIIYTLAFFFLGSGLLAALVGGIVWWIALGSLYEMDWLKALGVAIVVWIVAVVVGWFLPTIIGPL